MKQLLQLFLAFARVGVMTFGGGYAMIPLWNGRSWTGKAGQAPKS